MSARQSPVPIFVSYSHKDRHHLDKLMEHLAALQQSGRAIVWYDRKIEAGQQWEPAIYEQLKRSRIVIALVTGHFFGSVHCVEHELVYARELEDQGKCDLVVVLAESYDVEAHWIVKKQMLPGGPDRAVSTYRHASDAWTLVAKGIRGKIDTLEKNRVVSANLDCREEIMDSGQRAILDEMRAGAQSFENVSAFWQNQAQLHDLRFATVSATFSRFAPLIVGSPQAKRRLHKEFRQLIETNRSFGKRKSLTIDACMSMSAGQMVVRERLGTKPKLLLGLYSSIVRNSIPVFVKRSYYERVVEPLFVRSGNSESFEAIVTGRVFLLNNNFVRRFLDRQGLTSILTEAKIDDLCQNAFALEVGDENTGITARHGPPHYLDGDIWLAIRKPDGGERFMTSFVDITNAREREEELESLTRLAADSGTEIFGSYDQLPAIVDFDSDQAAK